MAAKKRLWLVRRVVHGSDAIFLVRSDAEPSLCQTGFLSNACCDGIVEEAEAFEEKYGISIPKGHVVPVESIQITLAGASRKAKVQ